MAEKKRGKYARGGLIQARVDNKEMSTIVNRAIIHTKGNVSDYVRKAALNYEPPNPRKEKK